MSGDIIYVVNSYSDIEDREEKLKYLVGKLKRNKENVQIEILRTKYKRAYYELLNTINSLATDILKNKSQAGVRIRERDMADFTKRVNAAILREQEAEGKMVQIRKSLYQDMDTDKFLNLVEDVRGIVLKEAGNYV